MRKSFFGILALVMATVFLSGYISDTKVLASDSQKTEYEYWSGAELQILKEKIIMTEIILKPVGVIRSENKEPVLVSDSKGITLKEKLEDVVAEEHKIRAMTSEIVIEPALAELLDDIEGYSHVLILFWAHEAPEESRNLTKVHPMGLKEIPKKGIFATCSPARPNPVLVTAVKLLERNDNVLKVQGLEAIDGSPVIDIKPYVQGYHGAENPTTPEWMEKIHAMFEEEQ